MILRLSNEEVELLRSALTFERRRIFNEIGQLHHLGQSPAAIQLCRRRSSVDELLDRVESPRPDLTVVPKLSPAEAAVEEIQPVRHAA